MATSWWNNIAIATPSTDSNKNYSFRRNLKIIPTSTIYAGYPLFAELPYSLLVASGKVRPDLADIEVLYFDTNSHWNVVPKQVTIIGDNITVNFNAVETILTTNYQYYIYMGNANLRYTPVVGTYLPAQYVIDTSTTGIGLTFTNPTVDWLDGVSKVKNAKASFSLFGINAKIIVETGPNRGKLEITLDDEAPIVVDTYSSTITETAIYTTSELSIGQHYIRMRVLGEKSAYSTDTSIKLVKVQYSQFTQGIDMGEEINPTNTALRITIGS